MLTGENTVFLCYNLNIQHEVYLTVLQIAQGLITCTWLKRADTQLYTHMGYRTLYRKFSILRVPSHMPNSFTTSYSIQKTSTKYLVFLWLHLFDQVGRDCIFTNRYTYPKPQIKQPFPYFLFFFFFPTTLHSYSYTNADFTPEESQVSYRAPVSAR